MADLYKGIAGSPITYLTSDISANQTTISIADDSALPDGPNICTIGYGENLETIKYETKSNGVLQNVTRGIEGTPQAWQVGTEVARFFTAYDHNSIIEDFVAHKAESASKHITESGSNENGHYIKFDDGTMICRGYNITKEVYGSLRRLDVVFPANFIDNNISCIISNLTPNAYFITELRTAQTYTQVVFKDIAGNLLPSGTLVTVSYIAIGRWK